MPQRFLTADWRTLIMLNYEVDPAILEPRVPRGVELDLFQDRAYVSMVGFLFLDTRVVGLPVPRHRDFEEVNLRFYVRREAPDGIRRGVVFVKEIVPRHAIAWVARVLYEEPYVALPMRHERRLPADGGDGLASYSWRLGRDWCRLAARFEGEPSPLSPGSEEEFITEHYWGYTRRSRGRTDEYRVEHPPWRVWKALDPVLEADAGRLYGPEFVPSLAAPPASAFVAEGSAVAVYRGDSLA